MMGARKRPHHTAELCPKKGESASLHRGSTITTVNAFQRSEREGKGQKLCLSESDSHQWVWRVALGGLGVWVCVGFFIGSKEK